MTRDQPVPRLRLREFLHQAMDQAPEARRAYLEQHLPAGETLEDALSLLGEMEDLGDFLETSSASLPFEPVLPSQISSYKVERILGWGSMGVVYLATQGSPSRSVAIKVLRVDESSPTTSRRFLQEGQVLARLSHPSIAAVFEAGTANLGVGPQPFLVMEYVDGLPITRYAEKNQLGREARVELVVGLARAVQHAHEMGVLHRDLKPENVLVSDTGQVCVLDFGVAHMVSDEVGQLTITATGQVIGTLAYMAPEQARGAKMDVRSDQFALGVILFELLTGELPFDIRGRLPHEALRVIADGDCRPPAQFDKTLSRDLTAIIMTVLAPEPVRRYASAEALAADLERYLAGQPIEARPPSSLENLSRFVRRHALLSSLLLVALLVLGGGAGLGANLLLTTERAESAVSLLSDGRLMLALKGEAAELWPTSSETIPAFGTWLRSADGIADRMTVHRQTLAAIEEDSLPALLSGGGMASIWLGGEGRVLLPEIEQMLTTLVPEMRERAEAARQLRPRTVIDQAEAWSAAASRVAADDRFDGYTLTPKEGLIPLGPDPDSRLEEFAVFSSGSVPTRSDGSGPVRVDEAMGIVLVLIPAGDIWIGAQISDPEAPNYDRRFGFVSEPTPNEGPPILLDLEPFMISKFEVTQAQWMRLSGENPSDWEAGSVIAGKTISATHPVETIPWVVATSKIRRWGLVLPTEAQWETAARVGGSATYMVGHEFSDLEGFASWNTFVAPASGEPEVGDDGYESHMPVGRLKPNAYGLHDVLGNVWEFCLDDYKVNYHTLDHRAGDGLVICEPDGDVSRRGHSAHTRPILQRVWTRGDRRREVGDTLTGIRVAWPLESIGLPALDKK